VVPTAGGDNAEPTLTTDGRALPLRDSCTTCAYPSDAKEATRPVVFWAAILGTAISWTANNFSTRFGPCEATALAAEALAAPAVQQASCAGKESVAAEDGKTADTPAHARDGSGAGAAEVQRSVPWTFSLLELLSAPQRANSKLKLTLALECPRSLAYAVWSDAGASHVQRACATRVQATVDNTTLTFP
jgi:hypothetical protein